MQNVVVLRPAIAIFAVDMQDCGLLAFTAYASKYNLYDLEKQPLNNGLGNTCVYLRIACRISVNDPCSTGIRLIEQTDQGHA